MRFLPCLVLVLLVGCGSQSSTPKPEGGESSPTPGSPTKSPTPGSPAADPEGNRFTNAFQMEFVRVPKGKTTQWEFYLGAYEVTQEQWQAVMGNNPSAHSMTGGQAKAVQGISAEELKRFPVDSVSWLDAEKFINLLNTKAPMARWVYRLPQAHEWSHACRAGEPHQELVYYFKNGLTKELTIQKANFGFPILPGRSPIPGSLGRTCRVGSYEPNPLGLYDMHGNVWEWSDDLLGNFKSTRVRMGGAYSAQGYECAAAYTVGQGETYRGPDQGVRVAIVPRPPR